MTARVLRRLDALRAVTTVDFETIVVDNASPDQTPQAIAAFPGVRYERFDANYNFAGACNWGAYAARAPIVLFLNNDAYPLGDAFAPLLAAFDRDEVAIAGGALFFEDGVTQGAGFVMLPDAHWHYSHRNLSPSLPFVERSRDAAGVSGAALAVRREWFIDLGGFHERYVNGFEDVELCMQAREDGRAIAYVADARFAHYEGASEGRFLAEEANERRFYKRWSGGLRNVSRTERGELHAIVARNGALDECRSAAFDDLLIALRDLGHPIVRDRIRPWQLVDRRYRAHATLQWFLDDPAAVPSVVASAGSGLARLIPRGRIVEDIPLLPGVAPSRVDALSLQASAEPSVRTIGVAGDADGSVLRRLADAGIDAVAVDEAALFGRAPRRELAAAVHAGLTDDCAYGNVLLSLAHLPAIALDRPELQTVFADDCAIFTKAQDLPDAVDSLLQSIDRRVALGSLARAEAQRRFSPRRAAIRIVDLLRAARFGTERPARSRRDSPIRL